MYISISLATGGTPYPCLAFTEPLDSAEPRLKSLA